MCRFLPTHLMALIVDRRREGDPSPGSRETPTPGRICKRGSSDIKGRTSRIGEEGGEGSNTMTRGGILGNRMALCPQCHRLARVPNTSTLAGRGSRRADLGRTRRRRSRSRTRSRSRPQVLIQTPTDARHRLLEARGGPALSLVFPHRRFLLLLR